jgi:hypothetical protein
VRAIKGAANHQPASQLADRPVERCTAGVIGACSDVICAATRWASFAHLQLAQLEKKALAPEWGLPGGQIVGCAKIQVSVVNTSPTSLVHHLSFSSS